MTEEQNLQNSQSNLPDQPTEDEISRLRELTGEDNVVGGASVPFINFDGQTGKPTSGQFLMATGEQDEQGNNIKKQLGESLQGVIVRTRKRMETGLNSSVTLRTGEFDGDNETIPLYDGQGNIVKEGNKAELQQYNSEIKLKNVIYIYSNEQQQVYRLMIPGGSLMNLWQYLRKFRGKDSVVKYVTKIGSRQATSNNGLFYYQLIFEDVGVADNWREIWQELEKLDSIIQQTALNKAPRENQQAPSEEDVKVEGDPFPDQNSGTQENINIDDVKF